MVGKVEKKEYVQYLAEARSWETSKVMSLEKSRNQAWTVAAIAGVLTLCSIVAVMFLTPLKTVQPYVIRVDNSTGTVDVVRSMKNGETNYDEAINKYFIQWYVRWREGYSRPLAAEYYNNVGVMSAPEEQGRYLRYFNPQNPGSPLNLYKDNGTVTIRIKSTSFISGNIALVRYVREVVQGGNPPVLSHWAATVRFRYDGKPMTESVRAINPLGFQVLEYRNDPDQPIGDSTTTSPINESGM